MRISRGLSFFAGPATQAKGHAAAVDACHVGVVLRAVLFVEVVLAVGVMFGASGPLQWFDRFALASAVALPATLAWLVMNCGVSRAVRAGPLALHHAIPIALALAIALGAVAGLQACALWVWVAASTDGAPWLASAMAGALLAALLQAALAWRAKGRTPADTAARLAQLQARIQPHFLFNTLNTAIALVRHDPARAEAVLEDLADLFRHALADTQEAVALSEEVALARHYLRIEQVRFGSRLQVAWDLDPRAGDALVPPLVLQPLVENAVKYGVEPSQSGAQVHIRTDRRRDCVVITVTNTVPTECGTRGQGLAQRNVRERLHLLHDVHGKFEASLRQGVYEVRLEVPA